MSRDRGNWGYLGFKKKGPTKRQQETALQNKLALLPLPNCPCKERVVNEIIARLDAEDRKKGIKR